ncbi:UDP-N-acetylglucosamine--N-acetylmuramyl- (pentapeptide) pyrophosphoryl-undecaprenol N-acetylglucosamine transferase [Desulfurobacterium thermolithotrophum DSM 11699]|uniref:UDP-N-acetylglucosamine--N-acetylmuramyl-(pentapeptide) pyrophosphoryl-undecaprenol N-acetylglucosamine transferase n=1 Tax=Desulfurobacterium thermolithotrophum (strain DSM 11699 / BSA) TaxID=868864 RepID=F0S2Q8_DESTD|nr:undecaprenyldiphospho-muramoylpentapeptide beta-N-acetylglucosaminyltransferase [Desulfurobacterium thermolithotrophum]ADY73130.1 UDP-N-acetylglucosamine--N-acetylmuramyl- (pentapeptide) pyrophosphoryl-undecaprenol N-acetylglucosamine transferase [Desulfurobacterium thermolithotrophum DSM 11699]
MKVLLGGGGTGGHLFPCLAVAEKLLELGHEVFYIGTVNGIEGRKRELLPEKYKLLNVKGVRGKGIKSIFNVFITFKAVQGALKIVREFKPDKVVLFGGYVSFPLGISAKITGTPLILQEQNSIPGRTNKLLSIFSEKVLIGYKSAEKFFGKKAVFTGNPTRKEIVLAAENKETIKKEILEELGLNSYKKTLLVVGGSQGALWLNEIMKKTVPFISKYSDKLQVVHITGEGKSLELQSIYEKAGITARVFPFFEKIWKLYVVADGAISRSGALAVSEISLFGIPTLFVPFPYAVDDHQYYNAKELQERGGCILKRQEELTPDSLSKIIENLLFDIIISKKLSENIKKFGVRDSTEKIVKEILKDG